MTFQSPNTSRLVAHDATSRETAIRIAVVPACDSQTPRSLYAFTEPSAVDVPLRVAGGCGPGKLDWAFPDGIFRNACNFHDSCYGGREDRWYRAKRSACDKQFKAEMYLACAAEYGPGSPGFKGTLCIQAANAEYQAVRIGGEAGYYGGHRDECIQRRNGSRRQYEIWARRMARS